MGARSHGKDSFEFEVRKTFQTKEEAIFYEIRFLKKVDAKKNSRFLNRCNGDGKLFNKGCSEETRSKLSAAAKGRKLPPRTETHKSKISATLTGRGWSNETREKIMAQRKNGHRKQSDETRKKISAIKTGVKRKPFTQEHKDKLSSSLKRARQQVYS